jgi:MoxR-like ATPase
MEFRITAREAEELAQAQVARVREKLFGLDEVIRLALVAFYTGGHVLLEGNPGFGKTELVKRLGKVLDLPFKRIQFTPDLIPADITGTYIPDPDNRQRLVFREGPIFTSLLLADEINRATPKTQSAMLEAMAELQVTVLGKKLEISQPFMVLATQNPIDHEGTYNLPEAQADRFMFKIAMPVPDGETLQRIVEKETGALPGTRDTDTRVLEVGPGGATDIAVIHESVRSRIREIEPIPPLATHIANMYRASNHRFGEIEGCDKNSVQRTKRLVTELITYGLGPRAAIALMNGSKAWALLFSPNDHADDTALARVAIPVLRHRIKLDLDWRERYHALVKDYPSTWRDGAGLAMGDTNLLERVVAEFCCATAPQTRDYGQAFKQALEQVFDARNWT